MLHATRTPEGSPARPANLAGDEHLMFLRRSEAATFLGLTPGTLANWASAGRGPAFHRVGGRVLYARTELLRFVNAGLVETADAA